MILIIDWIESESSSESEYDSDWLKAIIGVKSLARGWQ